MIIVVVFVLHRKFNLRTLASRQMQLDRGVFPPPITTDMQFSLGVKHVNEINIGHSHTSCCSSCHWGKIHHKWSHLEATLNICTGCCDALFKLLYSINEFTVRIFRWAFPNICPIQRQSTEHSINCDQYRRRRHHVLFDYIIKIPYTGCVVAVEAQKSHIVGRLFYNGNNCFYTTGNLLQIVVDDATLHAWMAGWIVWTHNRG